MLLKAFNAVTHLSSVLQLTRVSSKLFSIPRSLLERFHHQFATLVVWQSLTLDWRKSAALFLPLLAHWNRYKFCRCTVIPWTERYSRKWPTCSNESFLFALKALHYVHFRMNLHHAATPDLIDASQISLQQIQRGHLLDSSAAICARKIILVYPRNQHKLLSQRIYSKSFYHPHYRHYHSSTWPDGCFPLARIQTKNMLRCRAPLPHAILRRDNAI